MTPERLREFRAKFKLTQRDLAIILKRGEGWISNVERPHIRNNAKITYVIELSLRYYEAFPNKIEEALDEYHGRSNKHQLAAQRASADTGVSQTRTAHAAGDALWRTRQL